MWVCEYVCLWGEKEGVDTLLRTAVDWKEREEIVRGRSLDSKAWSFESSQRARRVSMRSNISSLSESEFAAADEDDDSAISFLYRTTRIKPRGAKAKLGRKGKRVRSAVLYGYLPFYSSCMKKAWGRGLGWNQWWPWAGAVGWNKNTFHCHGKSGLERVRRPNEEWSWKIK